MLKVQSNIKQPLNFSPNMFLNLDHHSRFYNRKCMFYYITISKDSNNNLGNIKFEDPITFEMD